MKRLWLPLCLIFLVLVMGGFGIYREAGIRLSHALERFRTALPAGASFRYGRLKPAFLLGGISLYDVSFHYRDTDFHARRVRFGYPKLLSNGTLSLASLRLDEPGYSNRTHRITAAQARFHHLLVPSSAETLHEGHGQADSMRSLAAIMSFEPEDITALRFGHMRLSHVRVTTTPDATTAPPGGGKAAPAMSRPFTMTGFSANGLTVEGYGQGMRVHALMNGLKLSLHLPGRAEGSLPPVLYQLLLPGLKHGPVDMQLALQHLEARQGYVEWLKRPFRHRSSPAEGFWQDPAATLWEKPGRLEATGLALLFDTPDQRRTITLTRLAGDRREEKSGLHAEAVLQGLATQLSPPVSLLPSPIALPADYHVSTTARQDSDGWRDDIQLVTSFGKDSPVRLTTTLILPGINPLHLSDDSVTRFLENSQCPGTMLTLQGTDLFAYYGLLAPQQDHGSPGSSPAGHTGPQPAGTPSQARPDSGATAAGTRAGSGMGSNMEGMTATPRFGALAQHRPILAPVLDFLLSPARRALTLKTGPLALADLAHITTDSTDEARFDRLHVLSVTTQEQ